MARYLIHGAGGVGCLIGGMLHLAGHDVTLIARGEHGKALSREGLRLKTPSADHLLRIPVVGGPADHAFVAGDTVVLAMKTQDCADALNGLARSAPSDLTVVCAQNGLEGERLALRLFDRVHGALVFVFAAVTAPGVVCSYASGSAGLIDFGRYPGGEDAHTARLARDFAASGFSSDPCSDIMAWKRGKLLVNLGNVVQAACGADMRLQPLLDGARREAQACFEAGGMPFRTAEEVMARGMGALAPGEVDGKPFPGGSTFQDLARGAPGSEVDYLNGEVVLLGRLLGVSTAINAFLQRLMREMIRDRTVPGSLDAGSVLERLQAGGDAPA